MDDLTAHQAEPPARQAESPSLRAALQYASMGWAVFPVYEITSSGDCTCGKECGSPGKHPRVSHGLRDATTDPERIRKWWHRWPSANVAIRTGKISALVVFDVDPRHGGDKSLDELEEQYGALPKKLIALTGGGGRHLFFSHPGNREVKNAASLSGYSGLDIRGDGGYVVAAPSNHVSGGQYRWGDGSEPDRAQITPLPSWVLELLDCDRRPDNRRAANQDKRIAEGTRDDTLASLAGSMCHRGMGVEAMAAALVVENERRCDPPLPISRVKRIAQSVSRYATGEGGADGSVNPHLPIIFLARQLDTVVTDSVEALKTANHPPDLFMRSGTVVRIRRDEDGNPVVDRVAEIALVEALARSARWERLNGNDAQPTRQLAGVVLARLARLETAFPALRGITEGPLLRPDGTVLDSPGYDAATRLVYAPPADFVMPRVPEAPTESELRAAVSLIEEPFIDFPFCSRADRATAWAALLTLPLRELIDGPVPLFLFDAPQAGTGKTLLAQIITVIAMGSQPGMMSAPEGDRDAEWRKRITSILLNGSAVAIIDNVDLDQPLESPSLAAVITANTWEDRILGRSEMVTLPARTVWIANGNNIGVEGDLPRRSVWCRMDAKVARPWTREEFRHPNLSAWVHKHRGELLGAIFTVARAWISAGRVGPDSNVPKLGSFESWRDVIGGMLRTAEVPGFLGNLDEHYRDSTTRAWWNFLDALFDICGDKAMPVSEIIRKLSNTENLSLCETFPEVLEDAMLKPESLGKRLGKAFSKWADTRFPSISGKTTLRIVKVGESRGSILWQVIKE